MSSFVDSNSDSKAIDSISSNDNVGSNEEALHLLSLSSDIINLIISMLSIRELSRLDSAYCNHDKRKLFLDILSDNKCFSYGHIKFHNAFKYIDRELTWIGSRKINITSLSIGDDTTYTNEYLTSNGLTGLSKHCSNLQTLYIRDCRNITDSSVIKIIKQCSNLRQLEIKNCKKITTKGIIDIIKTCSTHLEVLVISRFPRVTDIEFIEMSKHCLINLISCSIYECDTITDIGIKYIAHNCSKLITLKIDQCKKINDISIKEIAQHCLLETLDIYQNRWSHNITNTSLIEIARNCPTLTSLSCCGDNDIGLMEIGRQGLQLKSLKICEWGYINGIIAIASNLLSLSLNYCDINDIELIELLSHCIRLKELDIVPGEKNSITDEGITKALKQCNNLTTFKIFGGDKITDTSIKEIVQHHRSLTSCNINGCYKITDNAIIEIANKCFNLQSLFTRGCDMITDIGLNAVARNCHNLRLLETSYYINITNDNSCLSTITRNCTSLVSLHIYYHSNSSGIVTNINDIVRYCSSIQKHCSMLQSYAVTIDGTRIQII